MLGLLGDPGVGTIVVEHRDRLARFGVEYLEAALAAQGRRVVVLDDAEVANDLVRDMVEVLTGFCARLYGRRSAKRRATKADRRYPSSKTCSRCKTVKAKLSLSKRTYRCERCGLVTDRDLNAAVNLASLVESPTSIGIASGAGTGRGQLPVNAQGEERFMGSPRCSSTNCEDGSTAPQGQRTVTATRQQVAPKPVLVGSDR